MSEQCTLAMTLNMRANHARTYETFVLRSVTSRTTGVAAAVSVHVGLHPNLEVRTIVN